MGTRPLEPCMLLCLFAMHRTSYLCTPKALDLLPLHTQSPDLLHLHTQSPRFGCSCSHSANKPVSKWHSCFCYPFCDRDFLVTHPPQEGYRKGGVAHRL